MSDRPVSAAEAGKLFAKLSRYPHLAVAVSGGPDSLALLYLLSRWAAKRARGPKLTVLTVDHGLRPESRREAEMVARVTASLRHKHAILTWRAGQGRSGKLQEMAREARYDLMTAYCHAHEIPALLTAHHLDDQAETFLMRLKRGSGLDGLAAIPEASMRAGIALLRPLLDIPKARLVATLAKAHLTPADDPSNRDQRFERARWRASEDALAKLGLTPEALARSAKRLRRAQAALEQTTDEFLSVHATMNEAGYCVFSPGALTTAPEEIALRALARVLASVGGRTEPIRLSKLEALLTALTEHPDKTHTLAGCRIAPMRGETGIFRETRGKGLPELELKPGERALWDNRFHVTLGKREARPVLVLALGAVDSSADIASDWLKTLPRFARIALPACVMDGALMLPSFGASGEGAERGFQASFVGASQQGDSGSEQLKEACTSLG